MGMEAEQQANVNKSALANGFARALDDVQVKPLTPPLSKPEAGSALPDVSQPAVTENVVATGYLDNTNAKFADGEVLPPIGNVLPDLEAVQVSDAQGEYWRPEETWTQLAQLTELAQPTQEKLQPSEMSNPSSPDSMDYVVPVQVQMAAQIQKSDLPLSGDGAASLRSQLPAGMFMSADSDLKPKPGLNATLNRDDQSVASQSSMRNTMERLDTALRARVARPEAGLMAGTSTGAPTAPVPTALGSDVATTQSSPAELDKTRVSAVVQETLRAAVARGNNTLSPVEADRSPAISDILSKLGLPSKPVETKASNASSSAAMSTGAALNSNPVTSQYREVQVEMARVLPHESMQRAALAGLSSPGLRAGNTAADLVKAADSSFSVEAPERTSATPSRPETPALAALKPTVVAAPTPGGEAQTRGMDAEVREQIMRVMSRQALAHGKLTLQLNPHELGSLDIEFSTDKGEMQVAIVARETSTRDLLEASVARLRQNLQDAGVNVGQLDIRQNSENNAGQQFRQSGNQSAQAGVVARDQSAEEAQILSARHDGDFDIYV